MCYAFTSESDTDTRKLGKISKGYEASSLTLCKLSDSF